jgi:amidase
MSDPYRDLDATAQADLVRRNEVSPRQLVDAAIARIEKLNPKINAVIIPLFEKARALADSPDLPHGPFRGVPFLLKDLVSTCAGDPSHSGMQFLKRLAFVGQVDSSIITRFRAAGLVIVGRTNSPELGLAATTEPLAYGPTRNPWNPAHSTGGSSGGSAASVAARLVPAASASDGGGSIRIPASECGIVGLKPTRGRISLGPLAGEFWHGLATEGVVSLSVRDSAALLDVVSGPMPGDPYFAPPPERPFATEVGRHPGRLRVGLMTREPTNRRPLHPECVKAVEAAGRLLESLGHHVELSHPPAYDEAEMTSHFMTVVDAHSAQAIDMIGELVHQEVRPEDVEPYTWQFVEEGRKVTARQYITAAEWLQGWSRRMASWWADGHDLLVTPTISEPPPVLGDLGGAGGDPRKKWLRNLEVIPFTPAFNVTGQPGISLPLHWTQEGLPVGVHLVAAYAREELLIRVAAQVESAAPWAGRRPPISA